MTDILSLRGALKFLRAFLGVQKFSYLFFENGVTAQAFTYSNRLIQPNTCL